MLSTAWLGNDVGLEWGHKGINRKINFDRRREKDSFSARITALGSLSSLRKQGRTA